MTDLEYTGERVVPGKVDNDLWREHVSRYAFAGALAAGRDVLDAGCGSGYGSDLLAGRGARSVLGVDVSAEAVGYARATYRRPNLSYGVMSVTELALPDRSRDLVVSFEVIEHLHEQERLVDEAARVLRDDGLFVVSTPNRLVYRKGLAPNPYHARELSAGEFRDLLGRRFPQVRLFSQDFTFGVSFAPVQGGDGGAPAEEFVMLDRSLLGDPAPQSYLIAVCGRRPPAQPGDGARGRFVSLSHTGERQVIWAHELAAAAAGIRQALPAGARFALVDDCQLQSHLGPDARAVPFPEIDGQYGGPPADDTAALDELRRARQRGIPYLVIVWPSFWWLDHYRGLAAELRDRHAQVVANDRLAIFDLRDRRG